MGRDQVCAKRLKESVTQASANGSLGALSALVFLGGLASPGTMDSEEFTIVFFGCLHDALPGGPTRAEGGHEGPVLATRHHDVGVRLVEVVVELGEQEVFRAHPELLPTSRERHQGVRGEETASRSPGQNSPRSPLGKRTSMATCSSPP